MANSRRNAGSQTSETLQGNPEYEKDLAATIELLVPAGYTDVNLTFPPYWKPVIGQGFRATVLYRDEREESFPRYVLQSATKLDCRKGPVDDGEILSIQPGMNFSIGVYAALPLERFFGLELVAIATGMQRLPANKNRELPYDMWQFRTLVAPEVLKKITSNREEDVRFLQDAQRSAHREMLKELAKAQVTSLNSEQGQKDLRRRAMNAVL